MIADPDSILNSFSSLPADRNWAFESDKTDHWTHGYHRYPAKFPPQVVKKLLEDYGRPNDLVVDLFGGCGTTQVECKVHGHASIGIDINPVAEMITKAKTTAIEPKKLKEVWAKLEGSFALYHRSKVKRRKWNGRINYWFTPGNRDRIAYMLARIRRIREEDMQTFFLCALSNTLKTSSRWLQTSTKPQIDPNKKRKDPFREMRLQVGRMMKCNESFFEELRAKKRLSVLCKTKVADAKRTYLRRDTVDMIITSPPYVTSYEYADIHQLTGYWFGYFSDLSSFRKRFLGSAYSGNQNIVTESAIANMVVNGLNERSPKLARELAGFFNGMTGVCVEMKRVLRPGGRVCAVVGNTTLRDVKVHCAEVLSEILRLQGFKLEKVIKRKVSTKQLPTIRNAVNGRFARTGSKNSQHVYPEEYILIATKTAL